MRGLAPRGVRASDARSTSGPVIPSEARDLLARDAISAEKIPRFARDDGLAQYAGAPGIYTGPPPAGPPCPPDPPLPRWRRRRRRFERSAPVLESGAGSGTGPAS